MLDLRINGQSADLAPGAKLSLELLNPYLTYEGRLVGKSSLAALASTPYNRTLLGFPDHLQVQPPSRYSVEQYCNGHLQAAGAGVLADDGSMTIVEPVGEFFGDAQELLLTQLNLGTIAIPNPLTPVVQQSGQDALCFPTIYNPDLFPAASAPAGFNGRVNVYAAGAYNTAQPLMPWVFVPWLLNKIGSLTSTNLSGVLHTHPQLSKMVISTNVLLSPAVIGSSVPIASLLPAWTIDRLVMELRKLANLGLDMKTRTGSASLFFIESIYSTPTTIDWTDKANGTAKRRSETAGRLRLFFETDSNDAVMKEAPASLAQYATPGTSQTADLPMKLVPLPIDAGTGLPIMRVPADKGGFCRVLFWHGLVSSQPIALPNLAGISLTAADLAAQFWPLTEAARKRLFYVERDLQLTETDLATVDFKQKVYIDGVTYLIARLAAELPLSKAVSALLVRV